MGLYDEVSGIPTDYDDQFKCWFCDMRRYQIGDLVPDCMGTKNYSIRVNSYSKEKPPALFLIVKRCTLIEISHNSLGPIFSKWGVLLEDPEVEPVNPFKEILETERALKGT